MATCCPVGRTMELKEKIRIKLKKECPEIINAKEMEHSAVLIPLIQKENECHLLFEVRAFNLKNQPGEISFPGGKIDQKDGSPAEAALRETAEELGIATAKIDLLGELGLLVNPFNRLIHTFVGFLEDDKIKPNPFEVDHLFTLSLKELLHLTPEYHEIELKVATPSDFPFHKIPQGKNYPWKKATVSEFFYDVQDYVIWGLTAHLLHAFLDLIRE